MDFNNIFIPLNGQHYKSLDAAQKAAAPTINIGIFINTIINFVIISFAIFWVVKAMSRVVRKEAPPAPGPTQTEVLLAEIRDLLATPTSAVCSTHFTETGNTEVHRTRNPAAPPSNLHNGRQLSTSQSRFSGGGRESTLC